MNVQINFRQANIRHPYFRQTKGRQQGVALIVSLIILVSLTMLGLTTIQRATTDLAMAGNQRESGRPGCGGSSYRSLDYQRGFCEYHPKQR